MSCSDDEYVELTDSLVFDEETGFYARSTNSFKESLEKKLARRYGQTECHVTTSGTDAIYSLLEGINRCSEKKKWTLVYTSELYTGTPKLFKHLEEIHDMYTIVMDIRNPAQFITNVREGVYDEYCNEDERYTVFFFESCSNPHSTPFNWGALNSFVERYPDTYVICDNTWLTDVILNPFTENQYIDFIVTSLAKYYSGGLAMGGAIVVKTTGFSSFKKIRENILENIRQHDKLTGKHVSIKDCEVTECNIDNVRGHILEIGKKIEDVIDILKNSEKVEVVYCSKKYTINTGEDVRQINEHLHDGIRAGVVVFVVKCSVGRAKRTFKKMKKKRSDVFPEYKTSFGGMRSRIDPFPTNVAGTCHIRFAAGYADRFNFDLEESFEWILNELTSEKSK